MIIFFYITGMDNTIHKSTIKRCPMNIKEQGQSLPVTMFFAFDTILWYAKDDQVTNLILQYLENFIQHSDPVEKHGIYHQLEFYWIYWIYLMKIYEYLDPTYVVPQNIIKCMEEWFIKMVPHTLSNQNTPFKPSGYVAQTNISLGVSSGLGFGLKDSAQYTRYIILQWIWTYIKQNQIPQTDVLSLVLSTILSDKIQDIKNDENKLQDIRARQSQQKKIDEIKFGPGHNIHLTLLIYFLFLSTQRQKPWKVLKEELSQKIEHKYGKLITHNIITTKSSDPLPQQMEQKQLIAILRDQLIPELQKPALWTLICKLMERLIFTLQTHDLCEELASQILNFSVDIVQKLWVKLEAELVLTEEQLQSMANQIFNIYIFHHAPYMKTQIYNTEMARVKPIEDAVKALSTEKILYRNLTEQLHRYIKYLEDIQYKLTQTAVQEHITHLIKDCSEFKEEHERLRCIAEKFNTIIQDPTIPNTEELKYKITRCSISLNRKPKYGTLVKISDCLNDGWFEFINNIDKPKYHKDRESVQLIADGIQKLTQQNIPFQNLMEQLTQYIKQLRNIKRQITYPGVKTTLKTLKKQCEDYKKEYELIQRYVNQLNQIQKNQSISKAKRIEQLRVVQDELENILPHIGPYNCVTAIIKQIKDYINDLKYKDQKIQYLAHNGPTPISRAPQDYMPIEQHSDYNSSTSITAPQNDMPNHLSTTGITPKRPSNLKK